MPHLVCVYNCAQPSDLVAKVLKETNNFYRLAFKKSRLQTGSSGHHSTDEKSNDSGGRDVHFTPLADWNCSVGGNDSSLKEAHVLYLPGCYSRGWLQSRVATVAFPTTIKARILFFSTK